MAQTYGFFCLTIILSGIIGASGAPLSDCTCRNNNEYPGIGDLGVTNYYLSGFGGGTCYVDYDPTGSRYNNSQFFDNAGGTGTGYFIPDPTGNRLGNNGAGPYTYHHITSVFTGVTNFNYFYNYIFTSGTVGNTCSSYCGSTSNDCYACCKICCGGDDTPKHPFAADGSYPIPEKPGD